MSGDVWTYLETDWLDGVEVEIMNRDREALARRLRAMAEELAPSDVRQEASK